MSFLNLNILLSRRITFIIFIKLNKLNKINNKFIYFTIILSSYFLIIQIFEYKLINFNLRNSTFFSNFYLLTLFHIIHVILGTIIIIIFSLNKIKLINNIFIKIINSC